jgi:hypothetical protein
VPVAGDRAEDETADQDQPTAAMAQPAYPQGAQPGYPHGYPTGQQPAYPPAGQQQYPPPPPPQES